MMYVGVSLVPHDNTEINPNDLFQIEQLALNFMSNVPQVRVRKN